MRRRILIGGAVFVGMVAVGLLAFWLLRDDGHSDDQLAPGGPPPPEVLETLALLEGDADSQRQALTPVLDQLLAGEGVDDPVVPPGSRVEPDEDGWRSEIEGVGNLHGRLVLPDGEETRVQIGFTRYGEAWLVGSMADVE